MASLAFDESVSDPETKCSQMHWCYMFFKDRKHNAYYYCNDTATLMPSSGGYSLHYKKGNTLNFMVA